MGKRESSIPEAVKQEIAKELNIFDTVERDGDYGNVSSRNCGNIVKKAVERAGSKLKV